jgi:hypothetical protein
VDITEKITEFLNEGSRTEKPVNENLNEATGQYPELDRIAKEIADDVLKRIDRVVEPIKSKMPYKTQYVLEEIIERLEAQV